jgi:hypothetical protein
LLHVLLFLDIRILYAAYKFDRLVYGFDFWGLEFIFLPFFSEGGMADAEFGGILL